MTTAPPKQFQLSVKFIGGANFILGEYNSHEDAVLSARRFYEFHELSHAAQLSKRRLFYNFWKDENTLVIMEKYGNIRNPEGMFAILKIKDMQQVEKESRSYWTRA